MRRRSKYNKTLKFFFYMGMTLLLLYGAAYVSTPYWWLSRAVAWGEILTGEADFDDYKRFPSRVVNNAPPVFRFSEPAPGGLNETFFETVDMKGRTVNGDVKFDDFLASKDTTAFLVIKDDALLYERYFNGYKADSIQMGFSITKSFLSALIGIAIDEGLISSVDDPVTDYIPELTRRDELFEAVTIKHLLTMSSGISFAEGPPKFDDAKTYLGPDLRKLALTTTIEREPGRKFRYNDYNPILLGMILERAAHKTLSENLTEKIWEPLGMEGPALWSLDSETNGFEKTSSGISARAVDFAKFGRLCLNNGDWDGRRIISANWMKEATRPDTSTDPAWYYQYLWWVNTADGINYHFAAVGDLGQYLYIVPEHRLIMVRHGLGFSDVNWFDFFENLSATIVRGSIGPFMISEEGINPPLNEEESRNEDLHREPVP